MQAYQVALNNALNLKALFTFKEWQIISPTNGTAQASDTRKMTIGFCTARSVIVSHKINSKNVARPPPTPLMVEVRISDCAELGRYTQ